MKPLKETLAIRRLYSQIQNQLFQMIPENFESIYLYCSIIESIKESEKTRLENIRIHEKAKQMIDEEEQKEKEKFLRETYSNRKKK